MKTRWDHFETSIFAKMSGLAKNCGAINLAQGFPDFDGPEDLVQGAVQSLQSSQNQYAPSQGILGLRSLISASYKKEYDLDYNCEKSVGVFSGATEAIWCCVLALVDYGEEVLAFEPFYDSYQGAAHAAYAKFSTIPLNSHDWSLNKEVFLEKVSRKTKLLILNTPHNPTGKVFSKNDLDFIAEYAKKYDFYVLSDEVYEKLIYDDVQHTPIATLPQMWERTVTISSTSKTFGMTGWKIGYACAPQRLLSAMLKVHQYTVFCSATPLQYGMIQAFHLNPQYYVDFKSDYQRRRDLLVNGLRSLGWKSHTPQGSYFALAEIPGLKDDVSYAIELTQKAKVACIPVSSFCLSPLQSFIRFSFCKSEETLKSALRSLRDYLGA
ncbi:MAG: pyridoxal phosphate-dependent aminotransferase [Oligoflexales bacterium]